jgi:hypothetical protein
MYSGPFQSGLSTHPNGGFSQQKASCLVMSNSGCSAELSAYWLLVRISVLLMPLTGNIKAPASLGACHFPRKHPGKRTSESSSFPPGRILPPVLAISHIAWRSQCHLDHCSYQTPFVSQQAPLEETLLFHHSLGRHTRLRSVVHRSGS